MRKLCWRELLTYLPLMSGHSTEASVAMVQKERRQGASGLFLEL